jgi:hypothetical protein
MNDALALVDGRRPAISLLSSALSRPWSWVSVWSAARRRALRLVKMRLKSRPCAFQCSMPAHVEQVDAADQFVERAEAQLGHDLAHFFGDEEEVVDTCSGLPVNACAAPGPAWPRPPGRC